MDKEQLAIFVCGYTAMLLFVYIASWIREIAEKERQEDEKKIKPKTSNKRSLKLIFLRSCLLI